MNVEIKSYDDKMFSVGFPSGFDQKLLNAVRKIDGRVWNDEKKLWLLPNNQKSINSLLQNIYALGKFNVHDKESDSPGEVKNLESVLIKMRELLKVRHYSEKLWSHIANGWINFSKNIKEKMGEILKISTVFLLTLQWKAK